MYAFYLRIPGMARRREREQHSPKQPLRLLKRYGSFKCQTVHHLCCHAEQCACNQNSQIRFYDIQSCLCRKPNLFGWLTLNTSVVLTVLYLKKLMDLSEHPLTHVIYKMKSMSFWTMKSQQIALHFIYKQEKWKKYIYMSKNKILALQKHENHRQGLTLVCVPSCH